jgi:hypothetical protein
MWERQHVKVQKMAIAYSLLASRIALASSLMAGEACDEKHGSPLRFSTRPAFGGEVMIELTMAKQSTIRSSLEQASASFFSRRYPHASLAQETAVDSVMRRLVSVALFTKPNSCG